MSEGSSSGMVSSSSDNWDDEAAEADGHMSDLGRVSQTFSKVALEKFTLSFCRLGSSPLHAHKSLPCVKGDRAHHLITLLRCRAIFRSDSVLVPAGICFSMLEKPPRLVMDVTYASEELSF